MARQTLANKYRPHTFEDVVEQDASVIILQNQIATNTFKNALLFCGAAGTGKTTSARIFAKEINKGLGNPIEIDAASNNGIDNIREIIIKSQQKALDCEYKVFIIDECHALSNSAWQALLKIIEEPPAKTVFVFCTTDPQKIPKTILSRVIRFEFQRISFDAVVGRLQHIIEKEKLENSTIEVEQGAIEYIAKLADGGMRDAISMLDKCLSLDEKVTLEKAVSVLGGVNYETMFDLFIHIVNCEEEQTIQIIEEIYKQGKDLKLFIKQFTLFILDVCKYQIFNDYKYIQIPPIFDEKLQRVVKIDKNLLKDILGKVNELNSSLKWETAVKPIIELQLLMLCKED